LKDFIRSLRVSLNSEKLFAENPTNQSVRQSYFRGFLEIKPLKLCITKKLTKPALIRFGKIRIFFPNNQIKSLFLQNNKR